jgi:hypothetical protein
MLSTGEMSRKEMNFSTKELLEKIKFNRNKHAVEYVEAVKAYRKKLITVVKQKLEELVSTEDTEVIKGSILVSEPKCYLEEYDQIIDMLEMTKDEETTLSIAMFNQLVRDQWAWKHDFDLIKGATRSS